MKIHKRVIFSLIPVLVMVLAAEGLLRLGKAPLAPQYTSIPLPYEYAGISRFDDELFWTTKPNIDVTFEGMRVRTNSLGFRGPEIEAKKPGEYRILSLGESTTFGAQVGNEQTYSAVLEDLLRAAYPGRSITVINAGVAAYSSFQSLLYLKERGLALQPDMVLFYHELNDYLPSSLRDSKNTEIGISKSDRQLYEWKLNRLSRFLLDHSAIYGGLYYAFARHQIQGFQKESMQNPILNIGLPDIALAPRLREVKDGKLAPAEINEKKLPTRVLPDERLQNLTELKAICDRNHLKLIILHPSYMYTGRHECMLTQFCTQQGVPMVETFSALHPDGVDLRYVWADTVHPNPIGQRRIAALLLRQIVDEKMMETK